MVGLQLNDRLKGSLRKGMIVGGVAGVLSLVVLNGLDGVPIFGQTVPKAAAHAVILSVSSVATDYVVPSITPYISGGDVMWTRFENLSLAPLLIGTISLSLESLLAPQATMRGDVVKTIAMGAASSITASYVSSGLGWSAPLS